MYINNLLGWDLCLGGGLGDKETGCRYQSVHKQPFRLGLGDFGFGGDLCPLALQHASYLLLAAVYLGSAT